VNLKVAVFAPLSYGLFTQIYADFTISGYRFFADAIYVCWNLKDG
jgi:hypothetical protein